MTVYAKSHASAPALVGTIARKTEIGRDVFGMGKTGTLPPKPRNESRMSDRSHDFANYGMTFEELQEYKASNS